MDRREFLTGGVSALAGCGGEMEYQIQPSPALRTSANIFPGGVEKEWLPKISFLTPGDVSVIYTSQVGRYLQFGSLIIAFYALSATITHTTASGNFIIADFPHNCRLFGSFPVSFGNTTWTFNLPAGYTDVMPEMFNGSNYCSFAISGIGKTVSVADSTHFPTGGNGRWEGGVIYIAANKT